MVPRKIIGKIQTMLQNVNKIVEHERSNTILVIMYRSSPHKGMEGMKKMILTSDKYPPFSVPSMHAVHESV